MLYSLNGVLSWKGATPCVMTKPVNKEGFKCSVIFYQDTCKKFLEINDGMGACFVVCVCCLNLKCGSYYYPYNNSHYSYIGYVD